MITVDEIRDRLEHIEKMAIVECDDEIAHQEQDALLRDVLAAIAGPARCKAKLAEEAMRVFNIDFERYYS